MKIKPLIASIALGICTLGTLNIAHAEDTLTLGRTILLESGNQGAKIPLPICRNSNAIKLIAKKDLRLNKVIVTFKNGDEKTINFYRNMKKGDETNWRKFAYKRCVKNIEVFGNSDSSSAGVKVIGRK